MYDKERIKNAEIVEIKTSGIIVKFSDNQQTAWLPLREIDHPDSKDKTTLNDGFVEGAKFKVKIIGVSKEEKKKEFQPIVSIYRVTNDPWDKTKNWNIGDIKRIKITFVTKNIAFGIIGKDIEGFVRFNKIDEYFDNNNVKKSSTIQVGDYLAGHIKRINNNNLLIELNVVSFIQDTKEDIIYFHNPEKVNDFSAEYDSDDISIDDQNEQNIPDLSNMLILEDEPELLKYYSSYIELSGIEVKKASNEEEAISLLNTKDFDFAIVDVNLSGNQAEGSSFTISDKKIFKSTNNYGGLRVVCELNQRNKEFPVLLISGQDICIDNLDIESSDQIFVSGFLHKPFALSELRKKIIECMTLSNVSIKEIFNRRSLDTKKIIKSMNPDKRDNVEYHLNELQNTIKADSTCLFSIHNKNFNVKLELFAGDKKQYDNFYHKLRYSPVRDVAIDNEKIFERFMDNCSNNYPKHKYLHHAFKYKSCIGVPVNSISIKKYCLFVFYNKEYIIAENYLRDAELAAEKISATLERNQIIDQRKAEQPYILAGKSYGMMGHELSRSLSVQNYYSDLINQLLHNEKINNKEKLESVHDTLNNLQSSINRSVEIVKDFRNMVRGHQMKQQNIDIKDAVFQAARLASYDLPENTSIDFDDHIPDNLPTVLGKKTAVEQLFFNIINNAVQQITIFQKIRNTGKISIQIKKTQREGVPWLKVLIYDTGPGIHGSDFEKIFQMGYTTRGDDGLGLGLDIVRLIANEIGGSVRVQKSTLFVGSVFEVMLPGIKE